MWQTLYAALTARVGMYIGYLVPIAYLIGIVAHILRGKQAQHKRLGPGDLLTILALGFVSADFVYYGYLFLTHTGTLLPPGHLFVKYLGGGVLWLWIVGYCYHMYFARPAAGDKLKSRYRQLAWVAAGSVILGGVGMAIS